MTDTDFFRHQVNILAKSHFDILEALSLPSYIFSSQYFYVVCAKVALAVHVHPGDEESDLLVNVF